MNLEIVMFNMSCFSEWQKGISNRNYQVFKKLSKHPKVKRIILVDFLPFTFKRGVRNWLEDILYSPVSNKGKKIETVYKSPVSQMVKMGGFESEVYVFSTILSLISDKLVSKKLDKLLNKISCKDDKEDVKRVIWSYFPMTVDYFKNMKADLTVFDAVDNWIYHESFTNFRDSLKSNYKIIAKKSDLIFTVAKPLVGFFKELGRETQVYWISNGVDIDHFEKAKKIDSKDLPKGIKSPIIGYIGTIQDRFRVDLLEYIAKKNPDKSFLLVGPIWPGINFKKLENLPNIFITGRVQYKKAPSFLKCSDVGIIPHKTNRFITYTNSLKALEYLACGKPVVTTPGSGVERFSDLLEIANKKEAFNEAIEKSLKNNDKEKIEKRKKRLKQYDWKFKVDKMVNIILETLKQN